MDYRTHVFDMDGTLLVSNGLKTEAFRAAALPYGEDAAAAMVALHLSAGSISRRERVERFFAETPGVPSATEQDVEEVLARLEYDLLEERYPAAEYVPGAVEYLAAIAREGARMCIVTGVEEVEAVAILDGREEVLALLRGGVYGAPPNKAERLQQLVAEGRIGLPAVYYGDTSADYESARAAGLDFVLVTCDAEWDWRHWAARRRNVRVIEDFRALLPDPAPAPVPAAVLAGPVRVRVGRDGYATVLGERRYVGRSLAGGIVTVTP